MKRFFSLLGKKWEKCVARLTADDFPGYALPLLFSLATLFALLLIQGTAVSSIMEARNLRAAEEIIESGTWLLPTLNNDPRIKKPPLPTWAAAAMASLCGDTRNLFWLRLPNAIMSLLLLWFVFRFTADWYGRRAGVLALLILATSLQFIGEVQTARWDMFVGALGFGGLWATCRMFSSNVGGWRYAFLAILLGGASYLSKGPAAFATMWVAFFATVLTFFWLARRRADVAAWHEVSRHLPRTAVDWTALAIVGMFAIAIGNLWWFGVWLWYPDTWQTLQEDIISVNTEHGGAIVFYLGMAFPLIAPWSLLLLATLVWWARKLWIWQRADTTATNQAAEAAIPTATLFTFLWLAIALLVLSCIPAKKNRYFLMMLPILAVFLGMASDCLIRLATSKGLWLYKQVWACHRLIVLTALFLSPAGLFLLVWFGAPASVWLFAPLLLGFACVVRHGNWEPAYLIVTTAGMILITVSVAFLYIPFTPLAMDDYRESYAVKNICDGQLLALLGEGNDKLLWGMSCSYQRLYRTDDFSWFPWPAMLLLDDTCKAEAEKAMLALGLRLTEVLRFAVYDHREKTMWYLYRVTR